MGFTISRTPTMPYDDALAATREALSDEGFGILTAALTSLAARGEAA